MTNTETAALARIRQMADAWEQRLPEVIRTPAVVSALRAVLDAAAPAGVEPPAADPMFGGDGCTCIPFTRQTNPPRRLKPTDTVDMISGWERGQDCPHHAPAVPSSDQTALRDRIAAAALAAVEAALGDTLVPAAREEALAGIAAVLPEPTDRAASDLEIARTTNQRLNREKQRLESELAAYRRAVSQWEISERGTYIPHASLRAIGLASGKDILGSVRHLKHFERVEQAEAEVERLRADRAAALREAALHLYTALFPAVYDDMGQKAAEGVNRAVSELRRMAAECPECGDAGACNGGPCPLRRMADETATETPARPAGDTDCEHCDGSGLDPDAYFVNEERSVWTHAPCSACLPDDEDDPVPTIERVKHSGPDTAFCVLCLSGEHERVDEPAAGARQDEPDHVCNAIWARGEMDEVLGYLICGVCGKAKSGARQDGAGRG